jgi:hypothetical protein
MMMAVTNKILQDLSNRKNQILENSPSKGSAGSAVNRSMIEQIKERRIKQLEA